MSDAAAARALADTLKADLRARLGPRLNAVYLLGSLARGGFSPVTSDIDVGAVLLDPLQSSDAAAIDASAEHARHRHPEVDNPLSVFWGSIASLNGQAPGGRFPPFDRLDLIEHGELLAGTDVRGSLRVPDYAELVGASAEFAAGDALLGPLRAALVDIATLTRAGPRAVSKLVLFPVRFLFLLHTGRVAANAESASHYIERYPPPGAELVAAAMHMRAGRDAMDAVTSAALADVWLVCLDAYTAALPELGLTTTTAPLDALRRELAAYTTAS